jgi:hypothetical protein
VSVAHFYANENFPLPSVMELRTLGHEALTTYEAGNAGQAMPDDRVLDFATASNRALLTLNRRHFIQLHNAGIKHAAIVACTFDPDFIALARRIDAAVRSMSNLSGQLIRINRPG